MSWRLRWEAPAARDTPGASPPPQCLRALRPGRRPEGPTAEPAFPPPRERRGRGGRGRRPAEWEARPRGPRGRWAGRTAAARSAAGGARASAARTLTPLAAPEPVGAGSALGTCCSAAREPRARGPIGGSTSAADAGLWPPRFGARRSSAFSAGSLLGGCLKGAPRGLFADPHPGFPGSLEELSWGSPRPLVGGPFVHPQAGCSHHPTCLRLSVGSEHVRPGFGDPLVAVYSRSCWRPVSCVWSPQRKHCRSDLGVERLGLPKHRDRCPGGKAALTQGSPR